MTDIATDTAGSAEAQEAPHLMRDSAGRELPSGALDDVELEVVAILGKTRMTWRELKELRLQSTVELGSPLQSDVLVEVNGKPIARGEIVEIGGTELGIRITKLLDSVQ